MRGEDERGEVRGEGIGGKGKSKGRFEREKRGIERRGKGRGNAVIEGK